MNEFGLRCPNCGNTDLLNIEVRVWITVNEDRVEDPYDRSKFAHEPFDGWHWDDCDAAQCPKCDHTGTVATFHVTDIKTLAKAAENETGSQMHWYVNTITDEAGLIASWIESEVGAACLVDDAVAFFADRQDADQFVKVYGGTVQAV